MDLPNVYKFPVEVYVTFSSKYFKLYEPFDIIFHFFLVEDTEVEIISIKNIFVSLGFFDATYGEEDKKDLTNIHLNLGPTKKDEIIKIRVWCGDNNIKEIKLSPVLVLAQKVEGSKSITREIPISTTKLQRFKGKSQKINKYQPAKFVFQKCLKLDKRSSTLFNLFFDDNTINCNLVFKWTCQEEGHLIELCNFNIFSKIDIVKIDGKQIPRNVVTLDKIPIRRKIRPNETISISITGKPKFDRPVLFFKPIIKYLAFNKLHSEEIFIQRIYSLSEIPKEKQDWIQLIETLEAKLAEEYELFHHTPPPLKFIEHIVKTFFEILSIEHIINQPTFENATSVLLYRDFSITRSLYFRNPYRYIYST